MNKKNRDSVALSLFRYQAERNPVYAAFLSLLGVEIGEIKRVDQIPFMPISFFKTHTIKTGEWEAETVYTSSGTTGALRSRHYIRNREFYLNNTVRNFQHYFGDFRQYCHVALLPSYLERKGSSLIEMMDFFIRQSSFPQSGFFLNDLEALVRILADNKRKAIPTLLWGVSFALLDLAEQYPLDLSGIMVMETGGMKGRRREITRADLHHRLQTAFGLQAIYSEYGMTELLSQAYSKGQGLFYSAPTLQIVLREITDPFARVKMGKTGVINIIDYANLDSCSFIATEDLGRMHEGGGFEVLGRLDGSDLRGCNLLLGELG